MGPPTTATPGRGRGPDFVTEHFGSNALALIYLPKDPATRDEG